MYAMAMILGCYTEASTMAYFFHFFSNIGVLVLVISKCSSLNLENAMVLDDLVVVVSKDALVVIDQPEERSSNVTKLTLANGETRGDLTFINEQNLSDNVILMYTIVTQIFKRCTIHEVPTTFPRGNLYVFNPYVYSIVDVLPACSSLCQR